MSNSISRPALPEIFKALGNPHRLRVFRRLMSCCPPGTRCKVDTAMSFNVGELGEDLDIAPSTLSHHLKELNRAGLVSMERQGRHIQCRVDPDVLQQLVSFFATTGE